MAICLVRGMPVPKRVCVTVCVQLVRRRVPAGMERKKKIRKQQEIMLLEKQGQAVSMPCLIPEVGLR